MRKFPSALKISKITPIHKKGPKNDIKNHRPISVLPNISKIFENLIFSRIKHAFNSFGVLSENQFGFRPNKNTELAALNLIHRTLPAINNKQFALCVFLDFSACFDTISRDILLHKLTLYGIHNNSIEFLSSYFHNRQQYVSYNGECSNLKTQNIGVIQGSKNGPLFFDIYPTLVHHLSDTCSTRF